MKEMTTVHRIEDIDMIIEKSKEKIQIIFKHSTACPISRMSYEKMKFEYPLNDDEADVYYIGVIEQRPLSNYIAEKLGVRHESPQLLVIKDGGCYYNESHLMIDPKILPSLLHGN